MSKVKLVDTPYYKPGKCCNCGSSRTNDRKYIDIGLDLDWYGIVYFCTFCIREIANVAGLFKHYEDTLARIQKDDSRVEQLQRQGDSIHNDFLSVIEEVKEYFDNLHSTRNDLASDSDSGPGNVEETSGSGIDTPEPKPVETERTPTKSTSSSRRKNINSLEQLLNQSSGD